MYSAKTIFENKSLNSPTSLFYKSFTLRPRQSSDLSKISHSVRCELDFLTPRSLPPLLH